MDITLTDVLEHTDLVDRLAYPRLAALLTEPTVFDRPEIASVTDVERIADIGQVGGLTVRPLDLTDPDANYMNTFEQRLSRHERSFLPKHRVDRPLLRKPVSLGKPVPTGSLAGVPGDEATDRERRLALAAVLGIDNINDLED